MKEKMGKRPWTSNRRQPSREHRPTAVQAASDGVADRLQEGLSDALHDDAQRAPLSPKQLADGLSCGNRPVRFSDLN